ncbi:MAG: thioredoxin family protein [Aquificaceae bacterium]
MVDIKVYGGPDCKSCQDLYEAVKKLVEEVGLEVSLEKITDIEEIINFNALPVLMVNGKILHIGKPIPTPEVLREILTNINP